MPSKITTEIAIAKFREVHGDRYDYSRVRYTKAKDPVLIVCLEHGEFWQTPSHHQNGTGCPLCGRRAVEAAKRLTTKTFIAKAAAKHGDRYDYSHVVYKGNKPKVKIVCPEHGSWMQTPSNHLTGFGCPKCGRRRTEASRRLGDTDFFARCTAVHFGAYIYPPQTYAGPDTKIRAICETHGEFRIAARNHLWVGRGCPKCGRANGGLRKRKFTFASFVEAARGIHGDRYEYDSTGYTLYTEPMQIGCGKHGWFSQRGHKHLAGQGCPTCARQETRGRWSTKTLPRESRDKPCSLYYLRLESPDELFYKIGITSDITRRVIQLERYSPYAATVVSLVEGTLFSSMKMEEELHAEFSANAYLPEWQFPGYTECFDSDVLAVDD